MPAALTLTRNLTLVKGACLDEPGTFAILTGLVPGGSLYSVLHVQQRALQWGRKVCVMTDIARGMNYLHDRPKPIIHRDLTSHNILLDAKGTAVIADFGESCVVQRATNEGGLTKQPGVSTEFK